jgi:chemotaxis protein MotB
MAGRMRTRESFNIWPGFVDALTTLLIMLLFVLTAFIAAQMFLGQELAGSEKQVSTLKVQLSEEQKLIEQTQKQIETLRQSLQLTQQQRLQLEREKAALEAEKAAAEKRVSGLESELAQLKARIVGLTRELGEERRIAESIQTRLTGEKVTLEQLVASLERRLAAIEAERRSAEDATRQLTADKSSLEQRILALEAQRRVDEESRKRLSSEKLSLEQRVAALEAQRRTAEGASEKLRAEKSSLEERVQKLEAGRRADEIAQRKLSTEKMSLEDRVAFLERDLEALRRERDRLQAALLAENKTAGDQKRLTEEQAAEIALMTRQMAALRQQLAAIEQALTLSEAKTESQRFEIEDLGQRLNRALAREVEELKRYRSEFFGRLREVLGNRPDIRVVGDRFVFQSEVLFPVASDEINPAGREQLRKLARSLQEIATKIPSTLDWVLRVDGHTDRRPIGSHRFPSNWELSSARAIAVVRLLIAEGVPANRLVAAGFGEWQPLEPGESEDAYGRNRRIELKLTER